MRISPLTRRLFSKMRPKFVQKEIVLKSDPNLRKKTQEFVQLAFKEPQENIPKEGASIINIDTITANKALSLIDTSFESFFKNRSIETSNFDLLIKVAGEKKRVTEAINAFDKMSLLKVKKNISTYCNLVVALSKNKDFKKAMVIFEEGVLKFGGSTALYSSALFACARDKNYELAENIWTRATRLEAITPDVVLLTSMITVCLFTHNIKQCWTLFEQCEKWKIEPDDVLLGTMIRICAKSKSAEKAKLFWDKLRKIPHVRFTAHHYNALILALASRKDYAEEAIEKYEEMMDCKIESNRLTFVGLLEATSKLGDVDTAFNAIVQMNALKITHNDQIYDGLLKTYASALSFPKVPKTLKELYLKDAWKLFDLIVEGDRKVLTSAVLNSLLRVHVNADQLIQAEESVLPLFDKFGVTKNAGTYSVFIQAFFDKRNLVKVKLMFDNLVVTDTKLFNLESLNVCLDTFIRIRDVPRIEKCFDVFFEMKKDPERRLIQFLAEMTNLPAEIYDKLRSFKFGETILKEKLRTYFPVDDFDKQMILSKERQRNIVKKSK